MAHLGHMYANGQGVPQSNETALEWFTSSSDAGHPSGLYGLGYMYVSGQGVPQDHRRAFELFEEAAKQVSLPGLTSGWLCQMQPVALLSRRPALPSSGDLCCYLEAAQQAPLLPSMVTCILWIFAVLMGRRYCPDGDIHALTASAWCLDARCARCSAPYQVH